MNDAAAIGMNLRYAVRTWALAAEAVPISDIRSIGKCNRFNVANWKTGCNGRMETFSPKCSYCKEPS